MNKTLLTALLAAALFGGCESNIRPIQPIRHVEVWVPDDATTQPATQIASTMPSTEPATQAASTEPATAPATQFASTEPSHTGEHLITKIIDPNQTSRYIYKATYDNVWQHAMQLLARTGFTLDRKDYRLGILTTEPLPSSQIVEVWRPQQTNIKNALENTMHDQRRKVRLTISLVPGKPDFYEIAIQVLVERQSNPTETIGGPVFVEGSGFGRSQVSLRSDYTPAGQKPKPIWYVVGHDPDLEHKLLKELFNHI